MVRLIAELPETFCSMKFSRKEDIYVAKIFAGKKHFIGTLCIVNPHPAHIAITSHGREQVFIIEGKQYEFTHSVSRKGLPKLTARYTEDPVNSEFIKFTVPSGDPKLRWVKIQRDFGVNYAGFITDPVKNLLAQFFGVLPFGTKLNLVDPSQKTVKTVIVKPGGYNEEKECGQFGNTTSSSNRTNHSPLTRC